MGFFQRVIQGKRAYLFCRQTEQRIELEQNFIRIGTGKRFYYDNTQKQQDILYQDEDGNIIIRLVNVPDLPKTKRKNFPSTFTIHEREISLRWNFSLQRYVLRWYGQLKAESDCFVNSLPIQHDEQRTLEDKNHIEIGRLHEDIGLDFIIFYY